MNRLVDLIQGHESKAHIYAVPVLDLIQEIFHQLKRDFSSPKGDCFDRSAVLGPPWAAGLDAPAKEVFSPIYHHTSVPANISLMLELKVFLALLSSSFLRVLVYNHTSVPATRALLLKHLPVMLTTVKRGNTSVV